MTSFVLALLWPYWIGTVLGAVLAVKALRDISRSNPRQPGRGLAIVALFLVGFTAAATLTIGLSAAFPSAAYLAWAIPVLIVASAFVVAYAIHRLITIEESADLDAPAADIFAILSDPHRLASITAGHLTVVDVPESIESGGFRARLSGRTYAAHVSYTAESTDYHSPTELTLSSTDFTRDAIGRMLGVRISDLISWTIVPTSAATSRVSIRTTWRRAPVAYWGSMPLVRHRQRTMLQRLRRQVSNLPPAQNRAEDADEDTPAPPEGSSWPYRKA